MAFTYVVYYFTVEPYIPWSEILIAQLQSLPFESFEITDSGFNAYVNESKHYNNFLDSIPLFKNNDVKIVFKTDKIKPINWNAKWESNFKPIHIGKNCVIRSDFHSPFNKKYEIIINPKMSFGTGHHQTTFMMLEFALGEVFREKSVLDMGCGTGILAIMASKMGAKRVDAIDNDPWCVENSKENVFQNNCERVNVILGSQISSNDPKYDIIFANINRNILLNQLPNYIKSLNLKGILMISGFYDKDVPLLKNMSNDFNLQLIEQKEKDKWSALKFKNE